MSTAGHRTRNDDPSDGWGILRLILTEDRAAQRVVLVIALPLLVIVVLCVVPVIVLGPAGLAGLVPVAGAAVWGARRSKREAPRRR